MNNLKKVWESEDTRRFILVCGLLIGLVIVFIGIVYSSQHVDNEITQAPAASTQVIPAAENLTDIERYHKAQDLFAGCTDHGGEYEQVSDLIASIPKDSQVFAKSHILAVKLATRRKAYDHHVNEQARRAAKEQAKEERIAAQQAAHKEKEDMHMFTGDGDAKVAVASVRLRRSTESHVAKGNSTFVFLYIDVKNFGTGTVNINPNDFSLSTQDGDTVPYDADTFETGKPFPAVPLSPGQQSGGWLVFYLTKDSRYKLTRRDLLDGTLVEKVVIP